MIVEDNASLCDTLTDLLEAFGYGSIAFHDAESSIQFLRTHDIDEIDMIISDFTLPGKNGLEIIEYARSLRVDLPAAILSGCDNLQIPSKICFIHKPFQPSELKTKIDACHLN